MNSLHAQQQKLLDDKLRELQRIHGGLMWSTERLPALDRTTIDDPAVAERVAAITDRFCKLQDQLAGATRHVHAILGEGQRNFHDVVTRAVGERSLPQGSAWLKLRGLHDRPTDEYDLASGDRPALMAMARKGAEPLAAAIHRFAEVCARRGLLPGA